MRSLFLSVLLLCTTLFVASLYAADTVYYELWDLSNLEVIGGHAVTVLGDPQVVSTEIGNAVQFDGVGDRLLVDFNPIMDAKEFTIELVFKPDACYPNNTEPRFLHIQDPDDSGQKRVMIELRVDANNHCYMDGFIKTDSESLTLIDENLVHPTQVWQHVAITYRDSTFTTYFNGIKELSGTLHYSEAIINTVGKTSLGGRMNDVAFFAGVMKTLKVTHASLGPEEFIVPEKGDSSTAFFPVLHPENGREPYPVPADRFLQVLLEPDQITEDLEINIFNTSGRVCLRRAHRAYEHLVTLNTAEFEEGLYLLNISSDGKSYCKSFVVLH
jgi:hypothetical protein